MSFSSIPAKVVVKHVSLIRAIVSQQVCPRACRPSRLKLAETLEDEDAVGPLLLTWNRSRKFRKSLVGIISCLMHDIGVKVLCLLGEKSFAEVPERLGLGL